MTCLTVAPEVCLAFPGLRIEAVVAEGFAGSERWPAVGERLAALEAAAAAGHVLPAGEDDPHIAAWHAAYRAFGTNPRRERPSVDALRRRLARSGRLPRINAAVDCYNLVSVTAGVPAGAFDLGQVTGDIVVRRADGPEKFVPLGEPGSVESPRPGEVIYTDGLGVLTRHWNHRDADRTKITEASRDIVFLLETVDGAAFGPAVSAAAAALAALLRTRADSVPAHSRPPASAAAPLRASRPASLGGSGTGAVPLVAARFQSPPVKPCVRFSRTRLTDVLHRRHSAFPRQSRKGLGGRTIRWRLVRPRWSGDSGTWVTPQRQPWRRLPFLDNHSPSRHRA